MTKTVMRYTDGGPEGWMQSPTGEFVRYEDYAALERECRELQQLVPPDKFVWKLPDEPGARREFCEKHNRFPCAECHAPR
jgi:hypothetical protein